MERLPRHGRRIPAPEDLPTPEYGLPLAPDFDRPSPARVHDVLLGGASHGAVDRAFAAALLAAEPRLRDVVKTHRLFVRRVVRYLLAAGIDQFLDLGSGMPALGNVHEVVTRLGSPASVVYVDDDPVAVANGQRVLADLPSVAYLDADIRDVDAVLDAPVARGLLDLSRPVGLLAFSVLQHVPDRDRPAELVEAYLSRLARGSALGFSHPTGDDPRLDVDATDRLQRAHATTTVCLRGRPAVAPMLSGVHLVEPGLTWAGMWRPEPQRPRAAETVCGHWAAVGFRGVTGAPHGAFTSAMGASTS